jgi:DNA-binding XRE family transcriptional regulator
MYTFLETNYRSKYMKLKTFREKHLMITQDELARYCGVTSRTIAAWEGDEHLPKGISPGKLRSGLTDAVLDTKLGAKKISKLISQINEIDILQGE